MNLLEEVPKSNSTPFFSSASNSSPTSTYSESPISYSMDSSKTILIFFLFLIILLLLSGINIFFVVGYVFESIVNAPFFRQVLDLLGDTSGTAINKSSEIVADTTKGTIDIADGAVHDIGNLLIGTTNSLNSSQYTIRDPLPDTSENNIQKPLSASKTKWCLVGEYQNKRGCVDINESDKCLSGQVFPTQQMCLNPNLTETR